MTLKDYDEEKIWRRVNKKLDLRKFKKATTDRERFKLFKQALEKDKNTKNLLKMKRESLRKIFEFGIAQQVIEGRKSFQSSLRRFGETRRKRIIQFEGQLKKESSDVRLLEKAEEKGVLVRGKREKTTTKGRPTTEIVKLKGVTISKIYVLNGKRVKSVYQRGRRGAIARIQLDS